MLDNTIGFQPIMSVFNIFSHPEFNNSQFPILDKSLPECSLVTQAIAQKKLEGN